MGKAMSRKKQEKTPKKAVRTAPRTARAPLARKKQGACQVMRVIVKLDVGFGNHLTIRGTGGGLSWDRGIPLRNTAADEWVWESSVPCEACEFKILINDLQYEAGENHQIYHGGIVQYVPQF